MINSLRLRNFKAFRDTGRIDLAPITVLAGANSGGKSSVLQSLLLLKQTWETELPGVDLNLDGRFVEVSGLDDLVFGKPALDQSRLSYSFGLSHDVSLARAKACFPKWPGSKRSGPPQVHSEISFSFAHRKSVGVTGAVVMDRLVVQTRLGRLVGPKMTVRRRKNGKSVTYEGTGVRRYVGRDVQAFGTHFIPTTLMLDGKEITTPDDIFARPLRALENQLQSGIEYLGPLREAPRRAYLHSSSRLPEVGPRGEYAAQLLWLQKDRKIEYVPRLGVRSRKVTLETAVNDVFERLGLPQRLNVSSAESVIYQLLFGLDTAATTDRHVNIAEVGFGVSQLLPIVVMGLLSGPGSLLLFEQPEIHLHPRLQANLADFFLALTSAERHVVIETHSDHFINRLRRRVAEDRTSSMQDLLAILFVQQADDGRGAQVEQLKLDRFGVIQNWPADFLPEAADEAESIFRAGLKKRQRA